MISRRLGLNLLLAGGAAAATTVYGAFNRTRSAEAAHPPLGDFVEVNGRRVHYLQDGSGPDLVLLHGAGGNLREFAFDFMGRLTDRFRVTAFDRPGLGYSELVPRLSRSMFTDDGSSPAEQSAQLRDAADALGLKAPIVVGHSFGGIVALSWALDGLDSESAVNASSVVSLGGVAMPWTTGLGAYYTINGSAVGGAVIAPVISAFATDSMVRDRIAAIFEPQEVPEGYYDFIGAELNLRPYAFRHNIRQVNHLLPHVHAMAARYDGLTLPVEMVHGTADTTVPLDIHARPFCDAHDIGALTVLDGVGHMPHHADPEACTAAIARAARRAGL